MNILLLVFIYLLLIIMSGKRYIKYLPTFPIYPDNEKEVLEVKKKIKTRTPNDIEFFKLTDRSVS
jgi:hypothetical protein